MKCLVDTHLLIWATTNSARLPSVARDILADAGNECYFRAASIWEIAIKRTKHPDDMPLRAEDARQLFLEAGFVELPVAARHSAMVEQLPEIHSDPFDRVLVAQALAEGMTLVTHDHLIPQYGDFVVRT